MTGSSDVWSEIGECGGERRVSCELTGYVTTVYNYTGIAVGRPCWLVEVS